MKEKISIIIPTFNREKIIGRAIESVISQSYENWELLIIDDGSTDNTSKLVQKYTNINKKIKYFYQKNSGGPATPRNVGIEKSTGSFIAFLDSDDEWLSEKLEKQLAIFKKSEFTNLGFVGCNVNIINSSNRESTKEYIIKYHGNIFKKLIDGNFILSCTNILMRKDIIKSIGKFDTNLKYLDDFDMWLKISHAGYEFEFVNQPLFNYYIHNSNITKNYTELQKLNEQEYILNKYDEFKKNAKKIFRLSIFFLLLDNVEKAREYINRALLIEPNNIFYLSIKNIIYSYDFTTYIFKIIIKLLFKIKNAIFF